MRNRLRWCSVLCAVLGAAALAQAQSPSSYPDRPIRLVVAFAPGGATDTFARQITQELGEALGQSVLIENKPGAGGYIAWNYVATSDPDGYTLLMAENALGISQALYKKTSFDPIKQYDAIAALATSPLVLAVANNVKANSVAELIAYSRTLPQKMNYASAGIGSVSHSTTLSNPLVRERLANLDIEPGYAPGNVMKKKLENEIANWTKFIDAHGIKPE